jgi:hypothetical protein
MLADIVSGKTATADVCFLIAVVVFALAAVASVLTQPTVARFVPFLTNVGLALVALGFLVL